MTTEKIIDKVRKLLALAANAGTPQEAASAAAKATELMERHQITAAQTQIDAGEKLSGYGHQPIDMNNSQWLQRLLNVVARTNRCRIVLLTSRKSADVIGHRDDVSLTIDTYRYLRERIDAMAETAFRAEGYGHGKAWKTSYRNGAVEIISTRLREASKARQREATASSANALMVITNRVDETMRSLYPHLRSSRSTATTSNRSAYSAGRRDGASIGLSRPANVTSGRIGYLT